MNPGKDMGPAPNSPGVERDLASFLSRRDIWRGREPQATTPTVASGHRALDAALPGAGWPLGALTEICSEHAGLGELSLLLPALARLAAQDRWLGFVAPPYPLYAPALAQAGLPLARCLVVTPEKMGSECLLSKGKRHSDPIFSSCWAAEQLLRGGACAAVLLWSGEDDAQVLRRLQLAAEAGGALAVLYRPLQAAQRVSPAALRLRVGADRRAEIFKCRGTTWHAQRGLRFTLPSAWGSGFSLDQGVANVGAASAAIRGAANRG